MNIIEALEDEDSRELLKALFLAHQRAAIGQNASCVNFLNAINGSGQLMPAICAALLTTGGRHAPVLKARELLQKPYLANEILDSGLKVPGFGHSIFKDQTDPAFLPVTSRINDVNLLNRITDIKETIIENTGHTLYPNAAIITAAVAETLKLPPMMELWLFIVCRTYAWINALGGNESEESIIEKQN